MSHWILNMRQRLLLILLLFNQTHDVTNIVQITGQIYESLSEYVSIYNISSSESILTSEHSTNWPWVLLNLKYFYRNRVPEYRFRERGVCEFHSGKKQLVLINLGGLFYASCNKLVKWVFGFPFSTNAVWYMNSYRPSLPFIKVKTSKRNKY